MAIPYIPPELSAPILKLSTCHYTHPRDSGLSLVFLLLLFLYFLLPLLFVIPQASKPYFLSSPSVRQPILLEHLEFSLYAALPSRMPR